jgi:hypothetical protein
MTPLRRNSPTLAEYLGARGYATAGFVANTGYCSYDTGLNRGFTHYEDYVFDLQDPHCLRMALLVAHAWSGVFTLSLRLSRSLPTVPFHSTSHPHHQQPRGLAALTALDRALRCGSGTVFAGGHEESQKIAHFRDADLALEPFGHKRLSRRPDPVDSLTRNGDLSVIVSTERER